MNAVWGDSTDRYAPHVRRGPLMPGNRPIAPWQQTKCEECGKAPDTGYRNTLGTRFLCAPCHEKEAPCGD